MITGNSLMRLPQGPLVANNPSMGFTTFSSKLFEFRTWLGVTTEPVRLSTSMDSSLASSADPQIQFIKREDQKKQGKTKFEKDTPRKKKMGGQSKPPKNATIANHPNQKPLRGPKRTKDDSMAFDGSRHKNKTSAQANHMTHAPNQADHTHSTSTHDSQIKPNSGNLTRLDSKKSKDGRRKKPFGQDLTKPKNRNQTMNGSNHKSSRPTMSQPTHKTQAMSEGGKANRTSSQNTIKPASKNSKLAPKKKQTGHGVAKYPSKNQTSTAADPNVHSSRKPKQMSKTSNKGATGRNITTTRTGKSKGSKNNTTMTKGKASNLTAPSNSSSRNVPGPRTPATNGTQVPTPVSEAPIEKSSPAPTTSEATPEATPEATTTATPADTPAATPAATPEPTPPTPEATPTATPEATPAATPEATPAATPDSTPTATPDATPTATPDATPAATPDATPAATPDATPTATPDATAPTPEATPGATPGGNPDQSSQNGTATNDGTPMTSRNDTVDPNSQGEKPNTNAAPPDPMTSWIITFKMNATEDGVNQYEHKLNDTGAIIKYNYSPVLKGLAASVPDRSFTALSKDPNIDSFDPDTVMSAQPSFDGGGPVVGDADVVSEDG